MLKNKLSQILLHIVLWAFVIVSVIPFLSMFATSFCQDVFELPNPPRLLPETLDLSNYITVLFKQNFAHYFLNSLMISCVTLVAVLFISSLSAYGFARFDFPGKEIVFNIYLFTMMVPAILNLIAQYLVINSLGLINTYTGVILIYAGTGVAGNTFFLRGFFEDIPRELEESVIMDGGGRWTIYRHIILPLSKPALGTLGIGIFSATWGEYFTVLTLIKDETKRTLPVMLQLFRGEHTTEWGLVFAGAVIVFIPEIIMFVIVQKSFVQSGSAEGAIKG